MKHLTAIILTYNESVHVTDCVQSVLFADRVIVFDSGSTDDTAALAEAAGAEVITHPFENYAAQRNAALDAVTGATDWVLFVDADERVTESLASEVRDVINDPANDSITGWRIPRDNYIFGRLTRGAGWYPDYQTRLLQVGAAHLDPEKIVHEVAVLDGELGTIQNPFVHYNYKDRAQFTEKQERYSAYDARILYQQGVRLKPWTLISMPLRHFWWRFVTLKGYADGAHGLLLSFLMARYEFRKYRLLGMLWVRGGEAV